MAELPPPSSLRSLLEEKARAAGIGTAFITPEWWAKVRALHDRDGVTPQAIAQAFDVCLQTNVGKVHFFAADFSKYVAIEGQLDQAAVDNLIEQQHALEVCPLCKTRLSPEDEDRVLACLHCRTWWRWEGGEELVQVHVPEIPDWAPPWRRPA